MGDELKAGVGLSRKWDAREAGREVTLSTLKQLDGENPKFFLLFSTIHYEKYGGFEELLNGVWDVLPEGTPLIGGTVAGFMNNYGCYTRGVAALAVSYPNMDVAIGIGNNTKREPKKAGRTASKMIKNKLGGSKFKNKFLFVVISGPTLPQSEKFGTMKVITDKKLSKLLSKLTNISTRVNQVGLGRESEVLNGLCEEMMEYALLGISSNDDNRYINHYQFYNDEVHRNSVVTLGMSTDLKIEVKTSYGLIPTGKKAKITGTENWNYIIKSLDNKPAVDVFFEKTGIAKEIINDENIHRITPFLPIGCYHKDGILHPYPVASFLGEYILVGHDIVSDEIEFFLATGESLIGAVDESLSSLPGEPRFMIISSCAGRLETLGKMVYTVKERTMEKISCPFLTLYGLGEERKEPLKPPHLLQESFNIAGFF
ncbi:MAG TPA: hypothetical protein ENI42_01300 [Thermoplasmatales archaeon]|nr:hypothetical protein [Thermoplasmatales archaeon]